MASNRLRREPKQHRSRILFDAILEAVGRVAADREVTTKRVAELAGVSIGSLYDYFSSKESMIEIWSQAVVRQGLIKFHRDIEASAGRTLREALEVFVDRAIETRGEPGAIRTILNVFSRVGADKVTRALDAEILPGVAKMLRDHASETRPLNPELAAFIMVYAVRWITIAAAHVPGLLQSRPLRDELVHLVVAYTRAESASPPIASHQPADCNNVQPAG